MTADRKNKLLTQSRAAGASEAQPASSFEKLAVLPERALEEATGFVKENVADHLIWIRSRQAGLIVNGDLHVLHFRGDTSPYLRPTAASTAFHLLNLLRKELVPELRQAFNRARRTQDERQEGRSSVEAKRGRPVRRYGSSAPAVVQTRRPILSHLLQGKQGSRPSAQAHPG